MTVKNALAFNPNTTSDFGHELVPSAKRGQIFITDDKVTKGDEIVEHIKANPNDTFLVSKVVFDYLKGLGYRNVCMFDPEKTIYEDGRATAQGGLIFA